MILFCQPRQMNTSRHMLTYLRSKNGFVSKHLLHSLLQHYHLCTMLTRQLFHAPDKKPVLTFIFARVWAKIFLFCILIESTGLPCTINNSYSSKLKTISSLCTSRNLPLGANLVIDGANNVLKKFWQRLGIELLSHVVITKSH